MIDFDKLTEGDHVMNKKTGVGYIVCGFVTNATNEQDGQLMVMYYSDSPLNSFVREVDEFCVKFESIKDKRRSENNDR